MWANEYQEATRRTAGKFDNPAEAFANWSMGLAGEAGEVVDYMKKVLWQGHPLDKQKLKEELGDVCWYLARLADEAGLDLSDILRSNIEKLAERYPDGFSVERSVNRDE